MQIHSTDRAISSKNSVHHGGHPHLLSYASRMKVIDREIGLLRDKILKKKAAEQSLKEKSQGGFRLGSFFKVILLGSALITTSRLFKDFAHSPAESTPSDPENSLLTKGKTGPELEYTEKTDAWSESSTSNIPTKNDTNWLNSAQAAQNVYLNLSEPVYSDTSQSNNIMESVTLPENSLQDPSASMPTPSENEKAVKEEGQIQRELPPTPTIDDCLKKIDENGLSILKELGPELLGNESFMLQVVMQNGAALRYGTEDIKNNIKIVIAALDQNPQKFDDFFSYTGQKIQEEWKKIEDYFSSQEFFYAPDVASVSEPFRDSKSFMLRLSKKYNYVDKLLSDRLKDDPIFLVNLLDIAVSRNEYPRSLYSASNRLKNDKKFITDCVRRFGVDAVRFLQDYPCTLSKDKSFIEELINIHKIEYLPRTATVFKPEIDFCPIKSFDKEIQNVREAGQEISTVIKKNNVIYYRDQSSYEGKIDGKNRPSGDHGILKDKEGVVIREGKWRKGVLVDGVGTLLLDQSSLFIGPIRDGMPCGKGIKKSVFGEEEYIVNGYGTLPLKNGVVFVGDVDQHFPSGYGEIISKKGDLLREGIFHKNILNKKILTQPFSDSEIFRGEVDEENRPHGFGVVFSEKGMFFGKFAQGKLIGDRPKEKSAKILLFSAYTPERGEFNKKVIDNHKAYSEKHGYHYVEFIENLAEDLELLSTQSKSKTLPYFSKIAGMLRLLHLLDPQKIPEQYRNHVPKEFIWLDDDAVITKQSVKMEDVVSHYAPENSPVHIFLTQDILHQQGYDLNTAVLFVRNSKESRSVFSEIWSRRHKKTENEETYGTCQNQSCLHEQAALQDLVKLPKYDAYKYVRIIPQRDLKYPLGINTFLRETHDDEIRKKRINYDADPVESRWRKGDFIGQATGMAINGTLPSDPAGLLVNLREIFIDRLVSEGQKLLSNPSVFITDKKTLEEMFKKKAPPGSWILWKQHSQATTIISFWNGEEIVDTTANSDETIQTAARTYGVDKLIQNWPSSRS